MIFWTAFIVGLFGSLHCIGMCGPIALALPVFGNDFAKVISSRLLYNIGRTITYAFIGAIVGLAGQGMSFAGAQQWVSVLAGILLILIVFLPSKLSARITLLKPAYHFTSYTKRKFGSLLKERSVFNTFLIGLINGFLPCGLVYVALAGALATGSLINGMLYMTFFGLGTLPLMFAFSVAGQFIGANIRRKFNRLVPAFILALGVLFILRGLNLGIPFISPALDKKQPTEAPACH